MPRGPTNVNENPTWTTTNSFRVMWEYSADTSRVTQWTVRHREAQGTGDWTERSLPDPSDREAVFVLTNADSGKTFAVQIIATADDTSSSDIGEVQVTLSKYCSFQAVWLFGRLAESGATNVSHPAAVLVVTCCHRCCRCRRPTPLRKKTHWSAASTLASALVDGNTSTCPTKTRCIWPKR